MELLNCTKPAGKFLPHFLNKYRLTLWEATEVHLDNGVLLAAVSDMGMFGVILNLFTTREQRKFTAGQRIWPAPKQRSPPIFSTAALRKLIQIFFD